MSEYLWCNLIRSYHFLSILKLTCKHVKTCLKLLGWWNTLKLSKWNMKCYALRQSYSLDRFEQVERSKTWKMWKVIQGPLKLWNYHNTWNGCKEGILCSVWYWGFDILLIFIVRNVLRSKFPLSAFDNFDTYPLRQLFLSHSQHYPYRKIYFKEIIKK